MITSHKNRLIFILFIVALTSASIWYHWLHQKNLHHTSLLFIGIPSILSIILSFIPKPNSLLGIISLGITFFILISGIIFREGFICILMAAPLFYGIGAIFGISHMLFNNRKTEKKDRYYSTAIPILLILSIEGAHPNLEFERESTCSSSLVVPMTPKEVMKSMEKTPIFIESKLPFFFKMGFPLPTQVKGSGLKVGDKRFVRFQKKNNTDNALHLEVSEISPLFIQFKFIKDNSKINSWLTWKNSTVTLDPIKEKQTKITWQLTYQRNLDPAWYFSFWEDYAVELIGEYLIHSHIHE